MEILIGKSIQARLPRCSVRHPGKRSERSQEVQKVLLIVRAQAVEVSNNALGLGTRVRAPGRVGLDCRIQVARSSVMHEKYSLTQPPERRGTEVVRTRRALCDPVTKHAHVVNQQVREQISWYIRKGGGIVVPSRYGWHVAHSAPHDAELRSPIIDGGGGHIAIRSDRRAKNRMKFANAMVSLGTFCGGEGS